MKYHFTALIALTLMFISSNTYADCLDVTKSCHGGAVGWQNQCYHSYGWPDIFGYCADCGHGFCPKPPSIQSMPHKANAAGTACRDKLIANKSVYDGCSNIPKDPASQAFKYVFDHGACNEHDICYTTPGMSKAKCDNNFLKNMAAACNSFYAEQLESKPGFAALNTIQLGLCLAAAPAWTTAVVVAGEHAYKTDQEKGEKICK